MSWDIAVFMRGWYYHGNTVGNHHLRVRQTTAITSGRLSKDSYIPATGRGASLGWPDYLYASFRSSIDRTNTMRSDSSKA